jgi:hypothetical protein
MVVSWPLLAPLVRLTALNANRAALRGMAAQMQITASDNGGKALQGGPGSPYMTRQRYIQDIIKRHKDSLALQPQEFLAKFFPGLTEEEVQEYQR